MILVIGPSAPLQMPVSIFRAEDGSEWNSWEEAEKHETRCRLLSEKIQALGGSSQLVQLIQKVPLDNARRTRSSFIEDYLDGCDDYRLSFIADNLEEIVLFGKWLEPVLEECGPNPPPLKQSW